MRLTLLPATPNLTCGLPEPIMMNLAGCCMPTPSLSTVLTPLAELSSTTSTSPSSSRFTSSTYKMPLFARACVELWPGVRSLTPTAAHIAARWFPCYQPALCPLSKQLTLHSLSIVSPRAGTQNMVGLGNDAKKQGSLVWCR